MPFAIAHLVDADPVEPLQAGDVEMIYLCCGGITVTLPTER